MTGYGKWISRRLCLRPAQESAICWDTEPGEVVGKTPFDFMPPDEQQRAAMVFEDARRDRTALIAFENVNLHKHGQRVVLEQAPVPVLDSAGQLLGYRGIDARTYRTQSGQRTP